MPSESPKGIPAFVWVLLAVALGAFLCIGLLGAVAGSLWLVESQPPPETKPFVPRKPERSTPSPAPPAPPGLK